MQFPGYLLFVLHIFISATKGTNVIQEWQDLMGKPNPIDAHTLNPLTLRAKYGTDEVRNAVYGSRNEDEVRRGLDYLCDPSSPGYYILGQPVGSGLLRTLY